MTIVNLILIVLVLGVAVLMIYFYINSKKNAEVVTKMDVDDQTYTLIKMIEFIKRRLDEITKINLYDIGLSEEELKRRKSKKYELKKALKGCTYGDINDKKYVFNGYMDSGNTLMHDNTPVIFINKNMNFNFDEKIFVNTLTGNNVLKGKKCLISINGKSSYTYAYLCSSNENDFNGCECLLNIYLT